MDVLGSLGQGFAIALTPVNLLYGFIGAILGTAIGVLPGLGPSATIALLLPITYKIHPVSAVIMLAGIYYGAMFGGSTTSILLNIPGENASVVTCIDGYQMARQGRAGPALGICAIGSFFGGIVSVLMLVFIAPILSNFAIKFGPPEYASLLLLGLLMAVYLSSGSALKGLMMMSVGVILGMVGQDLAYGMDRFTFGSDQLLNGLEFVPVAMGLFGISEVLANLEEPEVRDIFKTSLKGVFPNLDDWRRSWAPILRSGLLGACMGVLPGGGPIMSSFASYAIEKRISKHPEQFGKGAIEGVVAPETANNAGSTSSFIPLMTLGIPTNAAIAMIFVAMMIHGIRPGPMLLQEHPDMFWGVIASMFVGNAILLALNLPLVGIWASLLKVPYKYLVLVIMIVCIIGAYSVSYSAFDVGMMMIFGVFGYLIRRLGFPVAPLVLALILAPKLERAFQQSMVMGMGSLTIFVKRPISAVFVVVLGLILLKPVAEWLWRHRRGSRKKA